MWSSKQGRAFILHNPLPHKPPIDFSRGSVHGLLMRYDPSQLVFGSTFFCVLIKISLWFTQSRKFLLLPLPTWFKTTSCVIWVAFLTVRLTVSWWWCQWLGPSAFNSALGVVTQWVSDPLWKVKMYKQSVVEAQDRTSVCFLNLTLVIQQVFHPPNSILCHSPRKRLQDWVLTSFCMFVLCCLNKGL